MSYPITFPDIPIKVTRFGLNTNQGIFEGYFSRKKSIHYHAGGNTDRWAGLISTPFLNDMQAREIRAWVSALHGLAGTFTLVDPDHRIPKTYVPASLTTDSTLVTADTTTVTADTAAFPGKGVVDGAGQSGHALITDGWPASVTVLKAGDRIQVETQYFVLTEDAVSDDSGNATFAIEPALRSAPTNGADVITIAPALIARLTNPAIMFNAGITVTQPVSFAFEEAL